MTPKQTKQFNLMLYTLKKIASDYQTSSQMRKNANKDWGVDFEDAIEMAYDNIQQEAKLATKGIKFIQLELTPQKK